jgi:hypothetical protein
MVLDFGHKTDHDSQLIVAMWFKMIIDTRMCTKCSKNGLNVNLQKSQESKQWKNIYLYTIQ